jgi:hypothetical protein
MSKFKVGDRVKLVNPMELGRNFWGRIGVVEYIEKDNQDALDYAVEFDEESPKFHDCFGHCVKNHGYWCNDEMIDLVEQEQYYNGKIFVVDSNSFTFEAGHIYEFVNGRVKINGLKYPIVFPPLKNFEAVKDYLGSGSYVRAMEVKED